MRREAAARLGAPPPHSPPVAHDAHARQRLRRPELLGQLRRHVWGPAAGGNLDALKNETFALQRDLLHERIDSDKNLAELFDGFTKANARPEAIVFTGVSLQRWHTSPSTVTISCSDSAARSCWPM